LLPQHAFHDTTANAANNAPVVLAAAACGAVDFITARGGDPERVAAAAGVTLPQLEVPTDPIDLHGYCGLFEEAARQTGEDNFGLWYGQQFEPHMLGLIGFIALASPTLGEAVKNLAHYFPLHQSGTRTRLVAYDKLFYLDYQILDGRIVNRRQDAELTMGMFANLFRHCLGRTWAPEEVHLEHAAPQAPNEHEQAFRAPIFFGRGSNRLVFRNEHLDRPMPGADPRLLSLLRASLTRVAQTTQLAFKDRLTGEIRTHLAAGEVKFADIAEALKMSQSTLLRRLEDEGIGFAKLVEHVRREQARAYLAQRHIAVSEIALLLGYSEISAFSRAFKRWEGMSPNQFRNAALAD
jgi:AraC-like DNA-binding protein